MKIHIQNKVIDIPRVEKIDCDDTHAQHWDIAEQTWEVLARNENPKEEHKRIPIISLQPQMGKTGCIITTSYIGMKINKALGKRAQFIYISAMSDLALREQTFRRLAKIRRARRSECGAPGGDCS